MWKTLITTSYFYDIWQSNKNITPGEVHREQLVPTCPMRARTGATRVHEATQGGHQCFLTRSDEGKDFYYAVMALSLPCGGCEYGFLAVINSAGSHALHALDKLLDLRAFEKSPVEEKCGLLVCIFYALVTFMRLKNRCVSLFRATNPKATNEWARQKHEIPPFCSKSIRV